MKQIVEQALLHWGMEGAKYELIAARENSVFRIDHTTGCAALRLHRRGYRTNVELQSELLWMQAVSEGGIEVPTPIPTASGDILLHIDNVQVDVLTWLSGVTLNTAMENLALQERALLFRTLGQEMARLHEISNAWSRPTGFDRVAWDMDGLLGENPLWGRFWENPHLASDDRRVLENFRHAAAKELETCLLDLDYGLIHADLVPGNVMVEGQALKLIDFDDGGFGFRIFEVATALLKYLDADDFPSLRAALIEGYTSIRRIDVSVLDLFLAIRATTYVGWNIARMAETGAMERNTRFINTARDLALKYLASDIRQTNE